MKNGFHKSQGTEIRRTDWSAPILIQLMNAQPENNRGCPWHPLKKMKKSDHCEEICVKALISKNNSTCKNAVSQVLYGS